MIHAYAILTGYIAMRGSMVIHAALLIAMIAFVRIPDDYHNSFPGGKLWYIYAIIMHLILALLNYASMARTTNAGETFKQGV